MNVTYACTPDDTVVVHYGDRTTSHRRLCATIEPKLRDFPSYLFPFPGCFLSLPFPICARTRLRRPVSYWDVRKNVSLSPFVSCGLPQTFSRSPLRFPIFLVCRTIVFPCFDVYAGEGRKSERLRTRSRDPPGELWHGTAARVVAPIRGYTVVCARSRRCTCPFWSPLWASEKSYFIWPWTRALFGATC